MGFAYTSCGFVMPKPIRDLLHVWSQVKLLIRLVFFHLGLIHRSDLSTSWEDHGHGHPATGPSSRALPPIDPESIKKRLPIVKFADFVSGSSTFNDENRSVCTICLRAVEGGDVMRELGRCSHVFHLGCLDKWVDQGQMTCPLCRSKLLPEGDERKASRISWVVDKISYLFGEH